MADNDPKTSESTSESTSEPEAEKKSKTQSTAAAKSSSKASSSKKPKAEKVSPKSLGKKGKGFFKFLFVLILLAGIAAGSWYLYQYIETELTTRDGQLDTANQQVAELAQQLSVTQQSQQNIERTLASFIGDQQRQMQALAERVRSAEGVRDGDWILAEAQYLLRLADQRLLISRDTDSAADLLQAADELLRELAYPELVAVRQALISDIASLRAAPSVDYQGLYFQILAAGRGIDALQLKSIEELGEGENPDSSESTSGIWTSAVSVMKATLSDLVVVRKNTDSADWLVDAEGEAALRGQLDLLVLQSLSALLSGDQDIYSSALNSAAALVSNSFEDGSQRRSVEQSFGEFANQAILTEVPDISNSLRAMEYGAELLRRINQGE